MVLENLGTGLKKALSKITGASYVDEKLINELVKDIQRALLHSDVNVKLVFALSQRIKDRAKERQPAGLTKKEQLVNIVYEELANFLGGDKTEIVLSKKPFVIMLVGLFGNGKTTTAGKLAKYFSVRGKKVAMISTDTWRPAAYEQLRQLGEQINVPVYGDPNNDIPVEIYKFFKAQVKDSDVIIVDTAGRDAMSAELVDEIKQLDKVVDADEKLLVIAADVGQGAQKQAQMFHDSVGVTGVVITKLDGTAKGGGAISACAVTGSPVKFIGVGEKIDALEEFKPANFVGRILGMGDIESLVEKAKLAFSEDEAADITEKMMSGNFTLIDLQKQMESVKKMGSLSKLMEMIPGMGGAQIPKDVLTAQEGSLKKWNFIMQSMTKKELNEPDVLNQSRIQRVAKGSGQSVSQVRSLIKHYRQSRKMMKMMKGKSSEKQMKKLMQKMQSGGAPRAKY